MQDKYRLYRRSNRAQGTFYAQNCETGARESLGTKTHRSQLRPRVADYSIPHQPGLRGKDQPPRIPPGRWFGTAGRLEAIRPVRQAHHHTRLCWLSRPASRSGKAASGVGTAEIGFHRLYPVDCRMDTTPLHRTAARLRLCLAPPGCRHLGIAQPPSGHGRWQAGSTCRMIPGFSRKRSHAGS